MTGEPWKVPRFAIGFRDDQLEEQYRRRGRTEPCCDCGEPTRVTLSVMIAMLTRPYLVICTVCAKHREIECGGTGDWTRDVVARPR